MNSHGQHCNFSAPVEENKGATTYPRLIWKCLLRCVWEWAIRTFFAIYKWDNRTRVVKKLPLGSNITIKCFSTIWKLLHSRNHNSRSAFLKAVIVSSEILNKKLWDAVQQTGVWSSNNLTPVWYNAFFNWQQLRRQPYSSNPTSTTSFIR